MEKLVLIDGYSILHRAFYGMPDLTNSRGEHTGAVLGFLNMLGKVVEEEAPDYLAVAFDLHAPTFRHKMYKEYKGNRKPMPEELREQVPRLKELLAAMNILTVSREGLEADDILGILSKRQEKAGYEVTIVSGDRDLLQLASEHIMVYLPKTKSTGTIVEKYYAKDVKAAYGVTPQEFIDVKALWGDTSDNVPGVPGIGEKTAKELIAKYHSIEECKAHAEELKPPRAAKNIVEFWDQAVLSKELVTIVTENDLTFSMEEARRENIYTAEAYKICKELELRKFLAKFQGHMEEISRNLSGNSGENSGQSGFKNAQPDEKSLINPAEHLHTFESILDAQEALEALFEKEKDSCVGYYLFKVKKEVKALSVSLGETLIYAPVCGDMDELLLPGLLQGLAKHHTMVGFGIKEDFDFFYERNLMPLGEEDALKDHLQDVSLMAYLLKPTTSVYSYDVLCGEYLGVMLPSAEELFGKQKPETVYEKGLKGKPEIGFEKIPIYVSYFAYGANQLYVPLCKALKEQGAEGLYRDMEHPLMFVLYAMEREGVYVDREALKVYGEQLSHKITDLEQKIYDAAGQEFNINSPKQLGEILFEKLSLPAGKKTKTGYSTNADVLNALAPEYPIVSDILKYRQYAKLKSTYADGLGDCIRGDGRIHPTFQQTVTATGRLSCTDPNLQNIPIRMEEGRNIRKVFLPREGSVFMDADYSQIELRVLAHLSGDQNLIDTFNSHGDIHRATAARVFHKTPEEITDQERRAAKAVNFGIVYGISSFGLGEDLHISKKEAQQYIDDYYEAYPDLKKYLEGLVRFTKDTGYAETMYGRRRPVPEIHASNFMQRSFGERIAMNSPVQGSAADIIKVAMIRVYQRLLKEGLSSRLILQVHDELLIETRDSEKEQVAALLREEMEHAAELSVPLDAEVGQGANWYEAH